MKVGIIGAGNIGGTVAGKWSKQGHEVILASRNPARLLALAEQTPGSAQTGTPNDAAMFGDVILVATPFKAWPELISEIGPALSGKVVIDATNTYPERDGDIAERSMASGKGSGQFVQTLLPEVRLVKAFNTLYFKVLADEGGHGIGLAIAGNDRAALATVAQLVRDAGFEPVVVGAIETAKAFDPGTPVYGKALPAPQLAAALGLTDLKK